MRRESLYDPYVGDNVDQCPDDFGGAIGICAVRGVRREDAFPAQLEAPLRAQGTVVRVVDKGISGDTTAGGLARVDGAFGEKPDLVILELGANDALHGIQSPVVRANLDAMITKVLASGTKLLLTGMRVPLNWGEDYRTAFDRIYPDLARLRRVPLHAFSQRGNPRRHRQGCRMDGRAGILRLHSQPGTPSGFVGVVCIREHYPKAEHRYSMLHSRLRSWQIDGTSCCASEQPAHGVMVDQRR